MITVACEAILFDCDGVLVDSTRSVEQAWRRWASAAGLDPDPVLATVHGRRTEDTIAELVAPHLRDEARARIDAFELSDAPSVTAIAGARELVAQLPRASWAVVTSGVRPLAEARLRAAGLPRPDVLVCAEDVARGKPDPDGYLLAAAHLGVDPSRTVVFEDAVAGARAGRAAGVPVVIGVGDHHDADLAAVTDLVVNDLSSAGWNAGELQVRYGTR